MISCCYFAGDGLKYTKLKNTHAWQLFCPLDHLICYVLDAVVVVVCSRWSQSADEIGPSEDPEVMMQSVKLALCFAFHLSFFVNILVRKVMQMSMWCFTALRHQRVSVIDIVPLCDKTTEYFLNVQPCSFITSS